MTLGRTTVTGSAVLVPEDRASFLVKVSGQTYRGLMVEGNVDAAEPDVMAIFDTGSDLGLVCRVCGSLVAAAGEYPRAHWDWHEAANGA